MAKKGISPVVAVVILIGLAVMAGGLLSSWVSSFISESSRQDTCAITTMYTVSETTYNSTSGEIKTKIKNTGSDSIYNFSMEVDNGTAIAIIPVTYPSAAFKLATGRTQYLIANGTGHNITGIETVTVLTQSCPGYSPSPVRVTNI